MIPSDSDRGIAPNPSENGTHGTEDLEATTAFSPVATDRPAGAGRYDFLGPPRAGDELGWLSQYRVRSLIGEGAIGLVFLAEDTHLSRPVALKVIKPELAGAPGVQSRFMREAQATAAIKHDHIVTIYQVGQDQGILFLAMEYLQGLSLQRWLERGRKPSPDLVLRIGREIAAGLAAAHRNGLIHRDIKPANIWLEAPAGRVKILDFGMASSERDDAHITQAGTVVGTPAYMAPEQARGETAGVGSDLFSLGCVLYRLSAGRLPFDGESILAVLSALASDIPRSLREIEPEVRPELDELVTRLLVKDPTARPASAQAVAEEIRAIERRLLAERQNVELSEDAKPAGEVSLISPPGVGLAGERGEPLPEPPPRPLIGRGAWRMAAVVFAAAVATGLGVFTVARPRHGVHQTAPRKTLLTPVSDTSVTNKAPLSARRVVLDPPNPEPDRASAVGEYATAATDHSTPVPSMEANQVAVRPDPSERSLVDRPEDQEPQRRGKTGEEGPSSMPPPPKETVVQTKSALVWDDWNPPVDPNGDCKIDLDPSRNVVRIAVPGTPHVLATELGRLNAPRLLRPVRGDFEATVEVSGVFHSAGRATLKEYPPYHGAGLLLWQDDRNYVRLEIATDLNHGKPRTYANFELRKAGRLAESKGLTIRAGSTRLRIERRGDEVRAAVSPDGVHWTSFSPLIVDFDDRLSVGITAINSASKPLNAGFERFAITRKTRPGDDRREEPDKPGRTEARPSS